MDKKPKKKVAKNNILLKIRGEQIADLTSPYVYICDQEAMDFLKRKKKDYVNVVLNSL
jgi:hypothetical protein